MQILHDVEQGSELWFSLRKKHITATDMNVIMAPNGSYFGKTLRSLYFEKISDEPQSPPNEAMKRGTLLEPVARELFSIETGIDMEPKVIIKDWGMASLDGMSYNGDLILEIKCPGEKDHSIALQGKVPDHYYPQMQWQMYVTDLKEVFYYSFDGMNGVTVVVKRDEEYIDNMIDKANEFYNCLVNRTPPEMTDGDYENFHDDEMWVSCISMYKNFSDQIKYLEQKKNEVKSQVIQLSDSRNAKGNNATLVYVTTKGRVNYDKIPELQGVDLEQYREPSRQEWRLTCR